jgi:hypothetical protein
VQFVSVLVSFIAVTISASPEPEVRTYNLTNYEPQSNFSASHAHESLKVSTTHLHPRRAWSTGIRQRLSSQAAVSGDYTRAWRSIFKNVSAYYDRGTVLIVSTDGTSEFTNVQDAIDQVPEFNTKRVTIYVTSGIYE